MDDPICVVLADRAFIAVDISGCLAIGPTIPLVGVWH